ncbi:MAG: neutral zinc metallopeptidase [Acidimicrobiales bacterium]
MAITLAVTAACAQESSEHSLVIAGPSNGGEEPTTPESLDASVDAALADVQDFWRETYPSVYGGEYEELAGGIHPYGPNTETPPCGPDPITYEEIANNAFYCPLDDLIAYDEATLIPDLAAEFGAFTVGIVFAHEWGHAIQFRAGQDTGPTLIMEMQADCFAGAWTRWIADGNSDDFAVTEEELNNSVAGMTEIRDIPGTGADDPLAHGLAFDRVGSFQDGFELGAARCAEYPSIQDELPIVEIPFTSEEEAATGGNLALDDLLPLTEQNLNAFYRVLFEEELNAEWQPVDDLVILDRSGEDQSCDGQDLSSGDFGFASGYCQDQNVVVLGDELTDALNELGDFAVGSEIGRLWTRAAQLQLDVDIDDLPAASLQADCLTGVWAAANFPLDQEGNTTLNQQVGNEEAGLVLSAGDLDETIQGFLTYGDQLEEETGTVFERVGALRDGFVEGVAACEEFGPLG